MLEKLLALSSSGAVLMGQASDSGSYFQSGVQDHSVSLAGINVQPGDIVYSLMGVNRPTSQSAPTGYTSVANLEADDSQDARLVVARKVMTDPVDTEVVFPVNSDGATAAFAVFAQVWRSAGHGVESTATGTDSYLCDPPSLAAGAGDQVVIFGVGAHSENVALFSSSDTTLTNENNSGSVDITAAVGVVTSDGSAFDPAEFTSSQPDSTSGSWCACTFSITEA